MTMPKLGPEGSSRECKWIQEGRNRSLSVSQTDVLCRVFLVLMHMHVCVYMLSVFTCMHRLLMQPYLPQA